MRLIFRVFLCVLCAALLCPSALAGEAETALPEAAEAEEAIAPAYPVPDYVSHLIETAVKELDYTEERSGVTKYGAWAGYPTAEWCAEFLCWCVNQTDEQYGTHLLNQTYPNYSGTNVGRDWFLSQGRYIARSGTVPGWGTQWWKDTLEPIEKNGYIPQPGDWMFLSNNAAGDTSHVAMVEYCARDAEGRVLVHVIEGNNVTKPAPQSVERNVYPLDYWQILGYGTVHDLADMTLRFGSEGPKVAALQRELIAAGLMEERYATGVYGAITTDAVKAVQHRAGILETGVANLETRLALRQMASQAPKGE